MTNLEGKCDIDVWLELQKLATDIISHTAFGRNHEEGKHIFELLRDLVILTIEAMSMSTSHSSTKGNVFSVYPNEEKPEKDRTGQTDQIDVKRSDTVEEAFNEAWTIWK
ncbi:cytochrome P450 72A13-like [Prosopis cineraria]|uniref:cytochrome P450 72A13-like n=1 Tax=Prosopis cineraria TaxID=364024 RepID=UPI00240F6CC1|nr:cytochrome P450 72A13-like [Prosopis cineraria]